jgi:hypothetical protein
MDGSSIRWYCGRPESSAECTWVQIPCPDNTKGTESSCDNAVCSNGGTCDLEGDKAVCHCAEGYTGEFCDDKVTSSTCSEKEAAEQDCQNGGACTKSVVVAVTNARDTTTADGTTTTTTAFSCVCKTGYSGDQCEIKSSTPATTAVLTSCEAADIKSYLFSTCNCLIDSSCGEKACDANEACFAGVQVVLNKCLTSANKNAFASSRTRVEAFKDAADECALDSGAVVVTGTVLSLILALVVAMLL